MLLFLKRSNSLVLPVGRCTKSCRRLPRHRDLHQRSSRLGEPHRVRVLPQKSNFRHPSASLRCVIKQQYLPDVNLPKVHLKHKRHQINYFALAWQAAGVDVLRERALGYFGRVLNSLSPDRAALQYGLQNLQRCVG